MSTFLPLFEDESSALMKADLRRRWACLALSSSSFNTDCSIALSSVWFSLQMQLPWSNSICWAGELVHKKGYCFVLQQSGCNEQHYLIPLPSRFAMGKRKVYFILYCSSFLPVSVRIWPWRRNASLNSWQTIHKAINFVTTTVAWIVMKI